MAILRNNSLIGTEVPKLIEALVEQIPEIASIKLFRRKYFRLIQEDPAISYWEQEIIGRGLRLREELGLSFWDSTLLQVGESKVSANNILRLATRHNPQDLDYLDIPRSNCTEESFRGFMNQLVSGQVLAISSAIRTNSNRTRHLPMIDFHCPESVANNETVKIIISELRLSGYIVASGASYHFYGRTLIDEEMLITMLSKSILFSPIVDHRWVGHQLLERACGLRISPGKQYQCCPKVIAEV